MKLDADLLASYAYPLAKKGKLRTYTMNRLKTHLVQSTYVAAATS